MAILIAEDNRISLKLMNMNLQRNAYETYTAVNGKAALAQLEQHDDIDLVVTDIMMPEMNGLELLSALKASDTWQHIPVIMCTVLSDFEMIKKACKMGCCHYITKPIVAGELIEKVKEALEGKVSLEAENYHFITEAANEKGVELLKSALDKIQPILEEQTTSTEPLNLSSQLTDLCDVAFLFGIQPVQEIFERLEAAEKSGDSFELQGLYIDLLGEVKKIQRMFLGNDEDEFDALMSNLGRQGSEVIDALENLVTAQKRKGVKTIRVSELELGMEAYDDIWSTSGRLIVVKGQKISETVADRLVQFASQSDVVEPFRVIPNISSQNGQKPDKEIDIDNEAGSTPIDFAIGLDAVDGDMVFLKELVHEFIEAFPEEIKTMQSLYREKNAEQIQRIAHSLKGSAGNLGMMSVFQLSYELEKMGSDSHFEKMTPVFEQLENAVDSVADFVEMYDW